MDRQKEKNIYIMTTFSEDEMKRYSRQLLLDGFGVEGQRRLRDSRVIVVGAGGLGSPVAYYLAAAGVGTIALADGDRVDLSNLQRQILHTTADLGRAKVESARDKLVRLNPNIKIDTYQEFLTPETALRFSRTTTSLLNAATIFKPNILSTTPASLSASHSRSAASACSAVRR